MRRIVLIILSMLTFLSTPAIAGTSTQARWTVTQRSGETRVVHPGLQPASVTVNQALAPGDVIVTGASGRATLARGADYIVVAPHSQLRLPAKPAKAGFTSIIQDVGTLLYKVRHTGVPHFSVDTPMLAAVVKGTTFTVVVEDGRSAVQVIEGIVEVTASDGGMTNLVHGGKTVFVERNNPKALITADAVTLGRPGDTPGEAIKISGTEEESLLTITAADAGQVRIEAPKIASTTKLVTTTVVATVPGSGAVTPVIGVATDVVDPVTGVLADVVAPVTGVVTDVVAPVTNVVTDVVAPVTSIVAPVINVVPDVVAPVTSTITTVIVPVVAELTTPAPIPPAVTLPSVTTPEITTPVVTVPAVTTPVVSIPAVTLPSLPF